MGSDTQAGFEKYYGRGFRLFSKVQYLGLAYDVTPNL